MKLIVILSLLCIVAHQSSSKELEWWETTIFYQIIPRSFMDSNGDGIGDLNGITSKLEYLKELGVGATWITPFFESPMYDFGYDISDFYSIDDDYGTMEDFEKLMAKAKELDIKVVLDLAPNHGSNESIWFQKALMGNAKYYNYYIWEDGVIDTNGVRQPPTNWISVFRNSAWTYREEVGKYYLHQITVAQPDFNYRNPDVVDEMKKIVRFWLDKGIAGFRVGAINHLFEVDKDKFGGRFPDEPLSGKSLNDPLNHAYLDHIYTKNLPESYDMIFQWRDILNEYAGIDGFNRVLMNEVYSTPQDTMKYFGEGDRGVHMPHNFALITDVNGESTAYEMKYAIDKFLTFKPIDKPANWVIGNHDQARVAKRYGSQLVDAGIVASWSSCDVYEIGMMDGFVSWEDTLDPGGCNTNDPINYWQYSRDPNRTPFHWSGDKNAGFSNASSTWLPVASDYVTLNVEAQKAATRSHLKNYQALAKLRQESVFRFGRFESLALNENIFAFRRWHDGEVYLVVVNMRDTKHDVNLTYFENVEGDITVVIRSVDSSKDEGLVLDASSVFVTGYEALVLKAKSSAMALKSVSVFSLCFEYLLVYLFPSTNL